ncbi:MAG: hypothetical protein HRT57_14300 [Crocinitomicaceae bacterium]|nr:hypothetical protein [Crocinitomicaceae bacterium]
MKSIIALFILIVVSNPSFSQEDKTTVVSNVTFTLLTGDIVKVGPNDEFSISFSAYSNYISYRKSGGKKFSQHYAKKVKQVTYEIDGEIISLDQYKGPGGKYVLLETVYATKAVTLYRGPQIGGKSHHYYLSQKKPGSVEVMFSRSTKTFYAMLKCKAIKDKYELNKFAMKIETMKELLDLYNDKCAE